MRLRYGKLDHDPPLRLVIRYWRYPKDRSWGVELRIRRRRWMLHSYDRPEATFEPSPDAAPRSDVPPGHGT